jgi:hypothetical protein
MIVTSKNKASDKKKPDRRALTNLFWYSLPEGSILIKIIYFSF